MATILLFANVMTHDATDRSAEDPVQEQDREVAPTPDRRTRVLLVEDEEDVREAAMMLLESEGFEVTLASDGGEALALLSTMPRPDVIVLDLMMPTITGWAFWDEQQRDPKMASIPVVVWSAIAVGDARLGAARILRKDEGAVALLNAIDDAISGR